ncbi:MAG TPA: hypothetical protein QGH10_12665, partial [Armatimonadota bacterium]|nr:hypothetical protein [Armatimonadota bacterium]
AIGHSRGSLARMLLTENGCLLVAGMAWGALSALVAVSPHVASAQAEVNWTALAGVLIAVLAIGLVTCIAAVGIALRADLVPALRRE